MTQEIRYKLLRNNYEYGELFSGNNTPTLRAESSGEIKMSLQGSFLPIAVDAHGNKVEVNWLTDEIKPELIIDGISTPLGVLMPSTVEPNEDKGSTILSIQAYDRCWKVRDTKVEGTIYLSAGTAYLDAVEGLLTASGITTIIKTPSNAVLPEAREDWKTGTSYLKIVNTLLSEINYKQLWFNENGFAVLEPVSSPTAENIQHIFTNKKRDLRNEKEVETISVYPKIKRKTDIYQAPNVFVCVCSNADKDAPMVAKAVNSNPQSPLSTMRRGRRIVKVVNVDNIASQEELQAYANTILYDSMTTGEIITIETPLLPGFGVQDVSAIKYDDVFGICIEKSWSMSLTPGGTMQHTLEKVVINLG